MFVRQVIISSAFLFLLSPLMAAKGTAQIKGTAEDSEISGLVLLEETEEGLKILVSLENAPPGKHGFHIHQFGDCGNTGKNAGGHFNPHKTDHGHLKKDGPKKAHMGDLGNIKIGKLGKGDLEVTLPKLALENSAITVAGRAFILHAKKDDFGQPTGNAGSRIGCGTILVTGP